MRSSNNHKIWTFHFDLILISDVWNSVYIHYKFASKTSPIEIVEKKTNDDDGLKERGAARYASFNFVLHPSWTAVHLRS